MVDIYKNFSSTSTPGSYPILLHEKIVDDLIQTRALFVPRREPKERVPRSQGLCMLEKTIPEMLSEPYDSEVPVVDRVVAAEPQLWIDKYAPKSYIELITEEYINREALAWLKAWDTVIFPDKTAQNAEKRRFGTLRKENESLKKTILLLNGPSGCGKSVLANIVADHSGYCPFEVNCSVVKDLLQRIRNALSIQNVSSNKPSCVILDQLDSCDRSQLADIETIIKAGPKRPLICLTNDQYVPGMKGIKVHAKILNFKTIHENAIYDRVKEVCQEQQLHIDGKKLQNLSLSCNMDIRCVINTLQITQNISSFDICDPKNTQRSIFDVWQIIFSNRGVSNLGRIVSEYGDYTLINDGIFENYPNVGFADLDLEKSALILDNLSFTDEIEQRLHEKQQYELGKFRKLPSMAANYVSGVPWAQLEYPSSGAKMRRESTETLAAMKILESQSSRKAGKISYHEQLSQVLPYIRYIFDPIIDRSEDEDGGKCLLESYHIFRELGFNFVKNDVEPPTFRVIRGFQLKGRVYHMFSKMSEGVAFARLALSALSIDQKPDNTPKKRKFDSTEPDKIVFLHHEGLTNAVRRRVKVRDLLP